MNRDPIEEMRLQEMKEVVQERKDFDEAVDNVLKKGLPSKVRGGTVLPLRLYPDEILTKPCDRVSDDEIRSKDMKDLISNMATTMYMTGGIGLAAPQVGVLKRLFVCDLRKISENASAFYVCINPEVVEVLSDEITMPEACLSIPGVSERLSRPEAIRVRWYDELGKLQEHKVSGWFARVFQHELDHLDGITMLNRMSRLQRRLAVKRFRKKVERGVRKDMRPKKKRRW